MTLPCTEAEAIKLCREAAFKLYPRVRRYFDLDGLQQEAWLALDRLRELWKPEKSSFKTFARNALPLRLIDFLRRQSFVPRHEVQRAKLGECEIAQFYSLDVTDEWVRECGKECRELTELDEQEEFERLLEKCPTDSKEIVRLLYRDELPQIEIARRIGAHPSRVSQLHKAGLERLRRRSSHIRRLP